MRFIILSGLIFLFKLGFAQDETIVYGRVMEKGQPEALPFVSVGFQGTKTGTTSDFEGRYYIKTNATVDTLIFSYVGYKTVKQKITRGKKQLLNIEMQPVMNDLREVVIKPGENPALRIIRKAQQLKESNDQDQLTAFDFDSYNKIDVSMNNISEKMKNRTVFKPLKQLLDTSYQMKNDEGKYILPVFISETFSHYYENRNPYLTKEILKGSSVNGIGVDQGSYIMDLLGASSMQFNFNENRMRILGKDFISPIATGSMNYYIYTLLDSMEIDGVKCFKIKINLRREEDLGFLGMMWIADKDFAIKQIDVELAQSANVNFVDRFRVQQEMIKTKEGPWLPQKTRMIFELAEPTENTSGFIAHLYRCNTNFKINEIMGTSFFDARFVRAHNNTEKDSSFWNEKRLEPFSMVEKQMFSMIDSIKNVPIVRNYLDIFRLLLEGDYRIGKLDWGPFAFLVGYNKVEQIRFRLGFFTNADFSKKWQLKPYVAYGTRDSSFKYGLGIDYIFSAEKWTRLGIGFKNDYDILGVTDFTSSLMPNGITSNLFAALSFAVPRARINRTIDYRINFITHPFDNWTFDAIIQNTSYEPKFYFGYKINPYGPDSSYNINHNFTYTAATIEARYAYHELMVVRGVERTRFRQSVYPVVVLSYTRGFSHLLGGQFDYDKIQVNISQHLSTGVLGNADYSVTAGKFFGTLPYAMLDIPNGSQTFIYSENNFSLMNPYEFVADQYVRVIYVQHFEGLLFNRIPLLKKWKLRNFALVKMAYGSINEDNKSIIPTHNRNGDAIEPVSFF
ncbi:MAG: DUF5686 family protein, partial [Bacteroidia bacterium]